MKDILKIRKQGKFYCSFEKDAYVLHAITGYKVSNGRVGFPKDSILKVTNLLQEHKISYVVIEQDKETDRFTVNSTNYSKYLKEGTKSFEKKQQVLELIDKIKNLSNKQVEKLVKYIEDLDNE